MQIIRSLSEISPSKVPVVATIGNFDGVHLGHRQIFRRVREIAGSIGGISAVITFIPHPLKVVKSTKQLALITTYDEKEVLIAESRIDMLLVVPFTTEFAAISAREFVRDVLANRLGISRLVIGYDYSFGRDREGNAATLKGMGRDYGFSVEVMEPIGHDGLIYSSSAIRRMVSLGDVSGVVRLLGRHFSVAGSVAHGYHRGVSLGYPTANILTDKELVPASGVYAVIVQVGDSLLQGACNIGHNPTFANEERSIEVFLFDFSGDLYGCELRLHFIDRIRDEQCFSGIDELKQAIAADVACCRRILSMRALIEFHENPGG